MIERGIPQPPQPDKWINGFVLTEEAWRWISRVFSNYPKVQTFEQTLTPSAVNATSESVQTFTVEGLTTKDVVTVNKPTNQSGLNLVTAWVSAANTLSIKFYNTSGGGITPTSEAYRIVSVRI